jgi:multidrug efflux pump subunit AcrA (membrane-fusion protein)
LKNNYLIISYLKFSKYWPLFFGLILGFVFSSCTTNENVKQARTIGTPVKIANPKITKLSEFMYFNANTSFLTKETIRSTFQGYIEKIYSNIGDKVKAGDKILSIITKEAYGVDSLSINLDKANFSGKIFLKAKTDGILTELNFNTGDFVSDGEQLAIISNPSSLAVLMNVPYQHVSKIKLHSKCLLIFPEGEKIEGVLYNSMPIIDQTAQTQTFLVKLLNKVSYPANLNIEIQVTINIVDKAVAVPKSSLQSNETLDQFWIMKLADDTTAIKVEVEKGIENDSLVQILKPQLEMNERIIIDGAYSLADTAKVLLLN